MAVTRAQAAAYLHSSFALFATEAGQTTFDAAATGYGPDIDNALRVLGYAEAALATAEVPDSDRARYFALLDYFAARRLWRRLGVRVSVSLGPASISYANLHANLLAIFRDAEAALIPLGLSGGWSTGNWNFDWLDIDPDYVNRLSP